MRALAAALTLAAGGAAAEPVLTFEGEDWRLPVERSEIAAARPIRPRAGALALAVVLVPAAGAELERLTAENLGERMRLVDGDGATLFEVELAEPLRGGQFAVGFTTPQAALKLTRALAGPQP